MRTRILRIRRIAPRRRRPGADGITPPPTASGRDRVASRRYAQSGPHPHRPHRRPVPPHRLLPDLRIPDPTSPDGAWRTIETKLGLDLEGGLRVEYQALPKDGVQPTREALNVIKDIIERRVNTTGVSEPVVVVQGDDRVVIELPGISDVDSVRRLVGQTGKLDFVPLGQTQATDGQVLDLEQCPPLFSGDQLESAAVGQDQTTGGLTVTFVLKNNGPQSGAQLFANYTRDHVGEYFAIALDGTVISAPTIDEAIPNGQVQIRSGGLGGFPREGSELARHGAEVRLLAVPNQGAVERADLATLGEQFLNQSLIAGFIGISLVILFMLLYYRLPGLIASLRSSPRSWCWRSSGSSR